jgi:hypothetical protein
MGVECGRGYLGACNRDAVRRGLWRMRGRVQASWTRGAYSGRAALGTRACRPECPCRHGRVAVLTVGGKLSGEAPGPGPTIHMSDERYTSVALTRYPSERPRRPACQPVGPRGCIDSTAMLSAPSHAQIEAALRRVTSRAISRLFGPVVGRSRHVECASKWDSVGPSAFAGFVAFLPIRVSAVRFRPEPSIVPTITHALIWFPPNRGPCGRLVRSQSAHGL